MTRSERRMKKRRILEEEDERREVYDILNKVLDLSKLCVTNSYLSW